MGVSGKMTIFPNGHQIVRATMINQGFGDAQFSDKPETIFSKTNQLLSAKSTSPTKTSLTYVFWLKARILSQTAPSAAPRLLKDYFPKSAEL